MVLPLEATRTSPGRMASAEIMFSHTAEIKCTSRSCVNFARVSRVRVLSLKYFGQGKSDYIL